MIREKKINEMGEKVSKDRYICRTCKRKVTEEEAREEGWHYCINRETDVGGEAIQYFNSEDVEYVCNKHYKTLPDDESPKFVEIGYPYYSSLLINNHNITTF